MTLPKVSRQQEIRAKLAHLGDRKQDLYYEIESIEQEERDLVDELNGLNYDRCND